MTQAKLHDQLMRAAWNGIIDCDDTFEEDATVTASVMGAKPTGQSSPMDDGAWHEWLFPDGSVQWIMTNADGRGIGTTDVLP